MNLGFIYPGQGSQAPGMGRFLYEEFPLARQVFEQASDSISFDLKKLCFDSDEKTLALTENTQPALLTTSFATTQVLAKELGLKPQLVAGHSIGEYAALVTAEVMDFSDAVRAVRQRGKSMQSAVPVGEGGMAAVMGLEANEIQTLCDWTMKASKISPLEPANFNCPGQIVISGKAQCIQFLSANFKAEEVFPGQNKRVKIIPLQVSAPFHCSMMKKAEEEMRSFLNPVKFQNAKIPVVQNFTAKTHSDATEIKENLIRQISAPVLWAQSMKISLENGFSHFIESGHGKVLAGLAKKIDSEKLHVFNVNSLEDLKKLEDLK